MSHPASFQSDQEERETIARARQGDKEAYRVLVEAYQDRLFGLALSLVHHKEQVEDLTQEIFVKAYFALPSFHGQSAFYTWLFRIASNHCLDYLRKHRPEEISLDHPVLDQEENLTGLQTLEAPVSEQPDVSLEAQGELHGLLNTLEPDQRLILTLREVEGYSYKEMAAILNCTVNTVKSRLFRAREALKNAYTKKYGNIFGTQDVQESEEHP
ncbi:MAG: sigma-70 family RNA polymerase sigma factor [Elusimicrobia bacterium]|nr:sigma-70 family RNA polymerase sigma factor [Elusimicrobiota bacterium]